MIPPSKDGLSDETCLKLIQCFQLAEEQWRNAVALPPEDQMEPATSERGK